ncbi:hypothetical protein BB561_000041 [Smittium simulii]|uniref:Uncharacterized protein n=1 Tax=Smittium simulii TaxID=133385 RepID=A0A2T9Z0X8_9FUNG|nr:hypothetical protein BB561_000041 [Smittium simulii]
MTYGDQRNKKLKKSKSPHRMGKTFQKEYAPEAKRALIKFIIDLENLNTADFTSHMIVATYLRHMTTIYKATTEVIISKQEWKDWSLKKTMQLFATKAKYPASEIKKLNNDNLVAAINQSNNCGKNGHMTQDCRGKTDEYKTFGNNEENKTKSLAPSLLAIEEPIIENMAIRKQPKYMDAQPNMAPIVIKSFQKIAKTRKYSRLAFSAAEEKRLDHEHTLTYILGKIGGQTALTFFDNGATHSMMHKKLAA